ncbi:MAG: alpha/beta hydrolase [Myxococcales bacterium]|nr:alpha/beta hydrolase [Myxococcales bacterium]
MQTFTQSKVLFAVCSVLFGACVAGEVEDDVEVGVESQEAGVFPSVSSFSARGPFATTQQSLGTSCTVHRPTTLGQGGVTHPVVIWGNGTGASPATYSALLSHLASHGFIVAAANTSNAGNGSQMLSCLSSLVSANGTPGNVFFQRVDTARVGASGHSQGGAGTIMAGRDARVRTTAPVQPYLGFIPGGGLFSSASIGQQRGPMLLISGSSDTIAVPTIHQLPVFNGVNQHVFWATRSGASHFEPVGNAGDFRSPLTAWFRSELMDDAQAAAVFEGPCTLCSAFGWSIRQRN